MIFRLDWGHKPAGRPEEETVEIKTLEDLEKLSKDLGNYELVIRFVSTPTITVYNDYLE